MSVWNRCCRAALFAFLSVLLSFCSLIDLRSFSVSTSPAHDKEVLPTVWSEVSVLFGAEIEKQEAERAFSVRDGAQEVPGDTRWEGRALIFSPKEAWKSGFLYRLKLRGSIHALDGRELQADLDIPFTVLRVEGAPQLLSQYPLQGASISVHPEADAYLQFTFSEPMDAWTVQDALSIKPYLDLDFHWDTEYRLLTARPKDSLAPCCPFHWNLSVHARSRDGAPLAKQAEGDFISDADTLSPHVKRTYPVLASNLDLGLSLGEIDNGQSIAIEFSEAMDEESLRHSIHLKPDIPSHIECPAPHLAIFTPERSLEPESSYKLSVLSSAKDLSGLQLEEYEEYFVYQVPYLRLLRIEAAAGELALPPFSDPLRCRVSEVEGLLSFSLLFSAPFDAPSRAALSRQLRFVAYFPPILSTPQLRSMIWLSSTLVHISFEDLSAGSPGEEHYYQLLLGGTRSGLNNGGGLFMKEDFVLFVEAVP
ncbi:hypothetical protein MASR2M78_17810 [Treponema sp.]